ncbi:MAG: cell surface protein SprA [Flavobacteriales bacterium]
MNSGWSHKLKVASTICLVLLLGGSVWAQTTDTTATDSLELLYPFSDELDPTPGANTSGLQLNDPSNVETEIEYDPESGNYDIGQSMGGLNYRNPTYMTFDEYQDYNAGQALRDYWREKSATESEFQRKPLIPRISVKGKLFETIFRGSTIDITPQGSAELTFGVNVSKVANPALPANQQTNTAFDFDQSIQLNVTGKIGEAMQLSVNYNTEATFDFENQTKLQWQGDEDQIIQNIEAGNVALPLTGSLIKGSQNLFGVKTELKFGRLRVTGIFSQQRGQTNTVESQGGAQITEFEVRANDYEEDRHFFLSHFFRDNYDSYLTRLPVVRSPVSVQRIEVYVTSRQNETENIRSVVAFMDLGETSQNVHNSGLWGVGSEPTVPNNQANTLYGTITSTYQQVRDAGDAAGVLAPLAMTDGFVNSQDFEPLGRAKLLSASEYNLNAQLGYISLDRELAPGEVLAVAYQYTYGGQVYQVGEFSTDGITGDNALILKLLKSTVTNPRVPTWDLMMKNIYNIGAYQVDPSNFRLDVIYDNVEAGTKTNYLNEGSLAGKILLRVCKLDQLNNNNDPFPDGYFDFVDGITVNRNNGRIIFPVIEPFGEHLRGSFQPGETDIANKYVYQQLYDSTKQAALQFPELNRFILGGSYTGDGGDFISLNSMNIPQGSVTVTAGSTTLQEGSDYSVDYTLGRVTILNEAYKDQNITASSESNSLFNIQQKTLSGVHLDYEISDDITLGGTLLHLNERPITQKVNQGSEPISNTIWGINGTYRSESRLITKIIDKIPLVNTKEISTVAVTGEFAHLIPGNASAISKAGIAYIDDFEGSVNFIDLKTIQTWVLASTPQGQPAQHMFPEGSLNDDIGFGYNRAKLSWYIIDPLFFRNNTLTPAHLTTNDQSSHFVREVREQEIFPNKDQVTPGTLTNMPILDLAYYPRERGPYNYDVDGITPDSTVTVAKGINPNGSLKDPETRWGGIMRPIQTQDFEENNIEFIQFWMMDPYHSDELSNHAGGDLYFNLGNVSEDVLRDGKMSYENGLPSPNNEFATDSSNWGIVSDVYPLNNAFDNEPETRPFQDIGYDGLDSEGEVEYYRDEFITKLDLLLAGGNLTQAAYDELIADPASDDFEYYRSEELDASETSILARYKGYNGLENNSPTASQTGASFQASSSTIPNSEDINNDGSVSSAENYFQYKVSLRREDLEIGKNYVTDKVEGIATLANGGSGRVNWYQFKIPVRSPEQIIGNIQDFRSIRFMRMFFKGFEDSVICRFARLELVRGEWRRYEFSLGEPGEYIPDPDGGETSFDISVVNIEENGQKDPVDYILPPGITRQTTPSGTSTLRQLNEQSLLLKTCGLVDGDARAAFKNTISDFRSYKRLKMYIHAEALDPHILNDDDVAVFVRMGTDFDNNYYEYEIPLKVTEPGATDPYDVWPLLNNLDIEFADLQNAKTARNRALISDPTVSVTKRYAVEHGPKNTIYVQGNPNIANVKSLMIGVRNPKKEGPADPDDGLAKCAEIWVNELRLTDFDNKGGWATTGQVSMKLADLATVNVSSEYRKFGFGAFDSRPSDRERESTLSYDLATTIQLGKFIPKKVGIQAPMSLGYSEIIATPEYNPLDPDIPMTASLADFQESPKADSLQTDLKHKTESFTRRRSLIFSDVRKTKTGGGKSHFWDVENLGFNYSYNQHYVRDIRTEYDETRTYQGGGEYDFRVSPKNVKPFKLKLVKKIVASVQNRRDGRVNDQKAVVDSLKKAKAPATELREQEEELEALNTKKTWYKKWSKKMLRSPWWKPIKDFNFNYAPSRVGVRTDLDRRYTETQIRNTTTYDLRIDPTYQKSFLWNREYHLKYDLTKAIRLQYDAFNYGRVDEPEGVVDTEANNWQQVKDSIWTNIGKGGRTTQYTQTTVANWTLPINKIPWFSWITSNASYTGNFTWDAAPRSLNADGVVSQDPVGNTVQNSQNMQINATANMNNLYNKVPFLKKINQKNRGRGAGRRGGAKKAAAALKDTSKTKNELKALKFIGEGLAGMIMSVKNVNFTYSETNGTLLPGYRPQTDYVGLDKHDSDMGNRSGFVPFLFGWQNINPGSWDIREEARKGDWLTRSPDQVQAMSRTHSNSLNARATLEPIKGLRIDVTAMRTYSEGISEFYRWVDTLQTFETQNQVKTGNFSMSYLSLPTAFESSGVNGSSEAFDQFLSNREVMAQRFAEDHPAELGLGLGGFPEGYGANQQEVLIAAFLAAYSGNDASTSSTSAMPRIPLPNWRATYDGLGKIKFMKKIFKSITFNHAYRSTYNVSSFTTNLGFIPDSDGSSYPGLEGIDSSGNFVPQLQINTVTLSEQFSPLFGVDLNWKNSLTTRFEYKKSRNISLSFSNNQLTEVKGEEYVVGAGYTIKDVKFPIKFGKSKKTIVSDLKMQVDVAIRDNQTIIRKIEEGVNQITSGQQLTTIAANFDYVLSPSINIRLFYTATFNNPKISSSFATENHAAGLKLRFTLTQ